mgnify:CR=1 FL=1
MLSKNLKQMHFEAIQAKIKTWPQIGETVAEWRSRGEKIVFTNGCFDLLHFGHVHYLAAASDLGDRLIVGLNSDASVRRLKGPHRPIQDEISRQHVMAALGFVDAVVLFEQDTPLELIVLILPDVLVKGGDWHPSQIVGSDFVLGHGGKVCSLPFVKGHSTTGIEEKIRMRSGMK